MLHNNVSYKCQFHHYHNYCHLLHLFVYALLKLAHVEMADNQLSTFVITWRLFGSRSFSKNLFVFIELLSVLAADDDFHNGKWHATFPLLSIAASSGSTFLQTFWAFGQRV